MFTYSNFNIKKLNYNAFLEKFGEIIVWSTIFIIGGIVIVGLSIALFNAIGIDVSYFYTEIIGTLGLVASPFVSLLVIDNINRVKLSVIVANIFLPLILVSLVVFGIISIFTKKNLTKTGIYLLYITFLWLLLLVFYYLQVLMV